MQLRVVEFVLTGEVISSSPEGQGKSVPRQEKAPIRAAKKSRKKTIKNEPQPKRRPAKVGPATILTELIGEGYFKKGRAIKDVIQHVDQKKARQFKANELSSPLARFVRDARLKREKNKDGQYEYTQP